MGQSMVNMQHKGVHAYPKGINVTEVLTHML